nr:glycogen/starch/alpha-glucan phosphorylase [Verrucomicrobium spinosum]
MEALHDKAAGETVSKILYPNDATESGKELRLVQQYFFVACSLSDIIRRYKRDNQGWDASRRRWRSSSMTRTRRWRSPS